VADPIWLLRRAVLDLHARELARHGGPPGIRDEGLLESASAGDERPKDGVRGGQPDELIGVAAQPLRVDLRRTGRPMRTMP